MTNSAAGTPDWDLEQLEVILEEPTSWQIVQAGPGAGKSAVACQRIAYLVDEGIPPSRMLLVSFTRTAVAEIRDRIVNYAVAGDRAKSVLISTIDSHAWSLRSGFDDEPLSKAFGNDAYDLSIARTVELFRQGQPDLFDFMSRIEHLIVDEAQDVTGVRADLIIEMLKSLGEECGVTILADPAQAIYGFTTDDGDGAAEQASLLSRLQGECPRVMIDRELKHIHRIESTDLVDLFARSRKEIERADSADGHIQRVQEIIRDTCCDDMGVTSYPSIAEFLARDGNESMIVLFRRRADVLFASSYCSDAGVQHRLRMSGVPEVTRPWIGWLFGGFVKPFIGRYEFDDLWEARASGAPEPFETEERESCWGLLHRLCAGSRPNTIDLVQLRRLVARARPPIELCYPDLGNAGPILGTIHASKGREADAVVLVMPSQPDLRSRGTDGTDSALVFEEGRVYYVGATRARKMLVAAGNKATRVGYLESQRVYRSLGATKAQLEIGRRGDVDQLAHLSWSKCREVQLTLAKLSRSAVPLLARSTPENEYVPRLTVRRTGADGITREVELGQMSESFTYDLGKLWSRLDTEGRLKPSQTIPHLHLIGVTTIGLTDEQRGAVRAPYNESGLALAPVVKGFPLVRFEYRGRRRSYQ